MPKKTNNPFYALTFNQLCDSLDITPLQRIKLAKWFFRKKVLKGGGF